MRAAILAIAILATTPKPGLAAPAHAWLSDAQTPQDKLTRAQHTAIATRLQKSITALQVTGKIATATKEASATSTVADLAWPLQPAPGFTPYGYHGVSNFVDHDPRYPGFVEDYTCGTRSYDLASGYNHAGTDYYLWPFPWLMMDQADVRIVAAAPGVIVEKDDGNFDRNCAIGASAAFNAVFVLQDDGLTAWYLHMKGGSLTTAPTGTRVATGDYLGSVGSSGSSSGPHLHFELTDANNNVVDPLHGQCNAAPDRWIVAQPYEAPRIDTLTTHSAEPGSVACGVANGQPVDEVPSYKDQFMPGDTLWAFASYSDQRNGEVSHFSIARPDGSVFAQWDFDLASQNLPKPFYSGTGFDWPYTLPADAPTGTWRLLAQFEGVTYTHAFEVGAAVNLNQYGLTGAWFNPATSGQGVVMEVDPDFYNTGTGLLFGGWFTYDTNAAGGRRWYTIQGQVSSLIPVTSIPIYLTDGGQFNSALATTTTPVGQATLAFSDCLHGSLAYTFSDGSGRSGVIPLFHLLPNASCTPAGDNGAAASSYLLSGGWADPRYSGQGLVFEFSPLQNVLFAAWYTYATNAGQGSGAAGQRWYTLQAVPTPGASVINDIGLYETSGGVFDNAATTTTTQIGTANLVFHSCNSATLTYTFTAGANTGTNGTLELVRLGNTPPGCHL